jgi:hypothetical protein
VQGAWPAGAPMAWPAGMAGAAWPARPGRAWPVLRGRAAGFGRWESMSSAMSIAERLAFFGLQCERMEEAWM